LVDWRLLVDWWLVNDLYLIGWLISRRLVYDLIDWRLLINRRCQDLYLINTRWALLDRRL